MDLNQLKHPDDVKKDGFGKWKYSGSHVFNFRACGEEFERVTSCSSQDDIFQLRRVHCQHPSNSQFQRLLAFITGMLREVMTNFASEKNFFY